MKNKVETPQDEGWRIFLKSEVDLYKMKTIKEDKWVLCNLELAFVIWYVMIEVWLKRSKKLVINKVFVEYAIKKLKNYEKTYKFEPKAQILLSLSYFIGFLNEFEIFEELKNYYKKIIAKKALSAQMDSKFVKGKIWGLENKKKNILEKKSKNYSKNDLEEKKNDTNVNHEQIKKDKKNYEDKEIDEKNNNSDHRENYQNDQDNESNVNIPNSIAYYFETNEFCSVCGTYIPEELVFSKFTQKFKESFIDCANFQCQARFKGKFNTINLDRNGDDNQRSSYDLYSPINLLLDLDEEFKFYSYTRLFSKECSTLYWNILFYMNLLGLPAFFIEQKISQKILDFSLIFINNYQICNCNIFYKNLDFKDSKFGGGSKTRSKTNSGIKDSFMSDKFNNSGGIDNKGEVVIKFSSKKDLYRIFLLIFLVIKDWKDMIIKLRKALPMIL